MKMKRVRLFLMAAAISVTSICFPLSYAYAQNNSEAPVLNTAVQNDLASRDIIDISKSGSLSIYKYDMTAAEASGDYRQGQYKATGESDSRVERALKDYAIEGVQFSYRRVGNVEMHVKKEGLHTIAELVYEIPKELASILKLKPEQAVSMTDPAEAHPCSNTGVLHYSSQQISDAMQSLLKSDNTAAKNQLEQYFYQYGSLDSTNDQSTASGVVNMKKTDTNGYTHADGLELGLYLIVETEVPENVVSTVDPWFVQLPFTNTSGTEDARAGGDQWIYDMTCYPKNQTGNPTLDKSVRNAYNNTAVAEKNQTVNRGPDYAAGKDSRSLVVFHDPDDSRESVNAAYISDRGGYTLDGITSDKNAAGISTDYQYRDTNTASEGDLLDYILVSRIPHITSQATYLSEYTFTDTLSKGLSYNQDVKIAFYDNADDANANNTAKAIEVWTPDSNRYLQNYAGEASASDSTHDSQLTVKLTESGLEQLNTKYSDCYMVVYYTATMRSDSSVVLGDEGNPNHVSLLWSRTSDSHTNTLEDQNYIYSYGLDLTKTFSDQKGNFSNVQFKLYNSTDSYYVTARKESDGIYYVTGKTTDQSHATALIPASKDGRLLVNGIEADEYQLTEVATDDGYSLLRDQIRIGISATDRDIIASTAGVTGMDADAVGQIVRKYNGGIRNENGQYVDDASDEQNGTPVAGPVAEKPDGNEIGRTDLYIGSLLPASAKVDHKEAAMTDSHAAVLLSVKNSKSFLLPQTGGYGLYLVTIVGILTAAGGICLVVRKKNAV